MITSFARWLNLENYSQTDEISGGTRVRTAPLHLIFRPKQGQGGREKYFQERPWAPLPIPGFEYLSPHLAEGLNSLRFYPPSWESLTVTGHMEAYSKLVEEEAVEFASQVRTQRRGSPAFEIEEEQLSFSSLRGT